MDFKKFAIKGIVILAIVIALCIFFSGTIRNIATPKVKIAAPRQGKLTQTVELKGEIVFPDAEKIFIADGESITVKAVKVKAGDEVKEGDVIFEAEAENYSDTYKSTLADYKEARDALDELDDSDIRLTRGEQIWGEAYEKYAALKSEYTDREIELKTYLRYNDLALNDDGTLPDGADDTAKDMYEQLAALREEYDEVKKAYDDASRRSVSDDAKKYITDRIDNSKKLKSAEEDLLELTTLNKSVSRITAPYDGWITEIAVTAGDSFSTDNYVYIIAPRDKGAVARIDTDESELAISKGMECSLTGVDEEVSGKLSKVGQTLEGKKYADMELSKRDIKDLGGMSAIFENGVTATVTYKAKESTTLIPVAALRGSGDERYIYILRQKESAFGTKNLVTEKMDVKVLAVSGNTASIDAYLYDEMIAYMEDRQIGEDTVVMAYDE